MYAAYAKAYASKWIVNNKESQTFNRGRFNRCCATTEGQQGLAGPLSVQVIISRLGYCMVYIFL